MKLEGAENCSVTRSREGDKFTQTPKRVVPRSYRSEGNQGVLGASFRVQQLSEIVGGLYQSFPVVKLC